MRYTLGTSGPMVRLLVQVHLALTDLVGEEPVWNEGGLLLALSMRRGGQDFTIVRQFSAEPGRLSETATLQDRVGRTGGGAHVPEEPGVTLTAEGNLVYSGTTDVSPAGATPLLMGRLLDRSTAALLRAATQAGVPGHERP